jgi:acyl-CoA dehydrogenase
MSDAQTLLIEASDRVFSKLPRGGTFDDSWPQVQEAGFASLLVTEQHGGFGGDWLDAFAVMRLTGYYAVALPVGEDILASWAAGRAGLDVVPDGAISLAPTVEGRVSGGRFTGRLTGVPWGRHVDRVLATVDDKTMVLRRVDAASVETHVNPAGEPRDTLRFDGAVADVGPLLVDAFDLGAVLRAAQIAGALDAVLEMSITYANERVQFGRPIGKFQALQQNLAILSEAAAAVNCAGEAVCRALEHGDASFEVAAAKERANRSAELGTIVGHAVHGAMGFTLEHGLHYFTRRLTAWRSEFGGDRLWQERLGRAVAAGGADDFWSTLTARSDRDSGL